MFSHQFRLSLVLANMRQFPEVPTVAFLDLLVLPTGFADFHHVTNRSYWAGELYVFRHILAR